VVHFDFSAAQEASFHDSYSLAYAQAATARRVARTGPTIWLERADQSLFDAGVRLASFPLDPANFIFIFAFQGGIIHHISHPFLRVALQFLKFSAHDRRRILLCLCDRGPVLYMEAL